MGNGFYFMVETSMVCAIYRISLLDSSKGIFMNGFEATECIFKHVMVKGVGLGSIRVTCACCFSLLLVRRTQNRLLRGAVNF